MSIHSPPPAGPARPPPSALTQALREERARLTAFVRRRLRDPAEAEDLVQDVLTELVAAWQLPEPIEQVGAWLMRVARHRLIDRFRKRRETLIGDVAGGRDDENDGPGTWLDELLPSRDDGPEAEYLRSVMLAELESAIEDLPLLQREVFVAHELEGRSFKDLAAATGTNLNTLLGRKRAAVLQLRRRLRALMDELDD